MDYYGIFVGFHGFPHCEADNRDTVRPELWLTQGKTLGVWFGSSWDRNLGKIWGSSHMLSPNSLPKIGKGILKMIYGASVLEKAHCNGIEEQLGTPDITSNCKYIAIFVSLI